MAGRYSIPGVAGSDFDVVIPPAGTSNPQYSFAHGASRAEVTYRIAWKHRIRLVKLLVGYPKIANRAGVARPHDTYVERFIPDALPDCTDPTGGEEWLFASGVSKIDGLGPTGAYGVDGIPEYKYAHVTIVYEPRTYKIVPDIEVTRVTQGLGLPRAQQYPDESTLARYVTQMRKPCVEYISLPRGVMRWVLPQVVKKIPLDYASARLSPSAELVFTWHEVPFVPEAASTHVGCVNRDFVFADPDDPLDDGYNPGTLLLLSAEVKPYRMASGAFVQDVVYRMKYFEPEPFKGHNYFLRYDSAFGLHFTKVTHSGFNDEVAIPKDTPAFVGDNGPYDRPEPPGKGQPIFPYRNFADLFRFHSAEPLT